MRIQCCAALRGCVLLCCGLLSLGFLLTTPSSALADDRVNPIEGTVDSGSDYQLLSNNTPGMVIVVTYHQIRARGYRSVFEILRDLPGFTSRGGFGQSPMTVAMDGEQSQNNEKFLLFIDGVLQQDLWRRSVWLSYQYSVYFIKNITVYYGPAATRFGANAMSGVIFIDTKKAEDLIEGYGDIALTKDVRNNMWAVDLMLGHGYNKRSHPNLAKNLFSWYLRGRFYFSNEANDNYSRFWNTQNQSGYLANFVNNATQNYRLDFRRAYPQSTDEVIQKAVERYRGRLLNEFQNDPVNSGRYANPSYQNQNLSFNAETGIRFDNWFLHFNLWSMGTGPGLRQLPSVYQTNSQWWLRNLSLSLTHLKSELWSSGVGDKAQVIYFNLRMTYQRHEVPSTTKRVNFVAQERVFFDASCTDPTGRNTVPCTWNEYTWRPTYYYTVSSSFRAEPTLDFRFMEGRLQFSTGFNAGIGFLQGAYITSNRPSPELNTRILDSDQNTEQIEHSYLSGFLQGQFKFTDMFYANFGVRSDWELVRGQLEVVPNCQRPGFPCYRFSAPLVGRASLISAISKRFKIRMSYGYAFLSPSNWQLFNTDVGDPLQARQQLPQDKHSLELNVFANISKRFYVTASVFHNWINNVDGIVILPFRSNQSLQRNVGNQRTLGLRLYSFSRLHRFINVITSLAFLYPTLDVFRRSESETANTIHLQDIPVLQASLIMDWKTSEDPEASQFFGSLRFNFQTSRVNTGFDQLENGEIRLNNGVTVDPNLLLNLSGGYMWIFPDGKFLRKISVSAVVENVFSPFWENRDLGIRSGRAAANDFPNPPHAGINGFLQVSAGF